MQTQEKYNIWELEFIKCGNSSKKLRNYIIKYKNISENPFVSKAKKLMSENGSVTSHQNGIEIKVLKEFDFISVLMLFGVIGLIALSCFISDNRRNWFKSNTTKNSNIQISIPAVKPICPASNTEPSQASPPSPDIVPNHQPQPYPVSSPYPYFPSSSQSDQDINRWEDMYRSQYAEMERQAERNYSSLTNLGIRYNNNGNPDGYTGRTDPYVATQISDFRQLQQRMKNLRYEASRQGVNISQSYWETANVNI